MSDNRVTLNAIENRIVKTFYFNLADVMAAGKQEGLPLELSSSQIEDLSRITVCALLLDNGYVQLGTSAAADLLNFDSERGRGAARNNAFNQLWPLFGFEMRNKITMDKVVGDDGKRPVADLVNGTSKDAVCEEDDGCPTERARLQREWREMRAKLAELAPKEPEPETPPTPACKVFTEEERKTLDILVTFAEGTSQKLTSLIYAVRGRTGAYPVTMELHKASSELRNAATLLTRSKNHY